MRRLRSTLLLLGVTAVALPCLAHDTDACLPMDDLDTLVCRHHFEGTSVELPVSEALEKIDAACEHLVVSVLQRQGLLLAELGEQQQFDAEQCSTMPSITVELPNVRSEADILVRFSLPEVDDAAGTIALRVYPDTLLEPLMRFAEQHALVVFDEAGTLTEFFDNNEIAYVQGFETVSAVPIALLVKPRGPERLLEDRGIDTAIIFQEKIVDLPQIRAVSSNGQTRVYVEMPFVHDLNDSPLAQKALLDIIRLATNPLSTDRG